MPLLRLRYDPLRVTGMTTRQRESSRLVFIVVLVSTLGGACLGLMEHHRQGRTVVQGALTGVAISLPLAAFEAGLFLPCLAHALRRCAFPLHLVLKTLIYFVVSVL